MLIPEVKEEHRPTKNNEGDGHRCHNDRTSNTTSSATTFDGGCQYKYVTNILPCFSLGFDKSMSRENSSSEDPFMLNFLECLTFS